MLSLPWLPRPPDDFRARCRSLQSGQPDVGSTVQYLAAHALDAPMSASLSKAIQRCLNGRDPLTPLTKLRLGILSATTSELLGDSLPAAAARHGVALELALSPFGQMVQQALDPESEINRAHPNVVLVALDQFSLSLTRPCPPETAAGIVDSAIAQVRSMLEGVKRNCGAATILQTIPSVGYPLFGSVDRRTMGSPRWLVEQFNGRLLSLADEFGAYLLDLAGLAERVGTDRWFDPVQWYMYKLPFAAECNEIVADTIGRLLGAISGKARKCLVLDLDNTLWGGAVGDDGLEGIRLGQGSGTGEAFLAVQQIALDLRFRGIMLAVASKNDDANARLPFRSHPEMLLREDHITVFQANWADKATNLEAIASTLNIGLDALVLLDDNPAERAEMRAALPMIAVPELPDSPSWFPWYLASAGYFEAVSFSAEDRLRADAYTSEARRAEVMEKARDLGDYLTALEMQITFTPFDALGRQRIAQLVNKSNQFNLTTRRYTEAEIAAAEADPNVYTLQVRLRDRFGNLGMIGVIIARPSAPETWTIDSWLMSCRVLGRRVEEAMRNELVRAAARAGVATLIGIYRPTAKNKMVADHYAKLGFAATGAVDGCFTFALRVADCAINDLPHRIEYTETEAVPA
jgi:FkbH-like protein